MADLTLRNEEYGAGTTYHWEEEYGLRGFGIAKYRINGKNKITVECRDVVYECDTREIISFIEKHPKSVYNAKGILLYVVPVSIFSLVQDNRKWSTYESLKKKDNAQLKLL